MRCPSCDHDAPAAEYGDPMRCPACGAYYEKALKLKLLASAGPAVVEPARETKRVAPQKSGGLRLASDHVEVATRGLDGVQPVVVVDIQMRFWSMMVFMVKWMFAAIPALIVFIAMIAVLSTVFGTFFSVLFGVSK